MHMHHQTSTKLPLNFQQTSIKLLSNFYFIKWKLSGIFHETSTKLHLEISEKHDPIVCHYAFNYSVAQMFHPQTANILGQSFLEQDEKTIRGVAR